MTKDNLVKAFSELKHNCKGIANKFTIKYHNTKALKKSAQLSVKDHCYFHGLSMQLLFTSVGLSTWKMSKINCSIVNMVNKSPFQSFKKSN
jgi:hypothetical protein